VVVKMFNPLISDGEELRGVLTILREKMSKQPLGRLIEFSHTLMRIANRYEHPTLRDHIDGIQTDSPEYLTTKPLLEKTLEEIYEEISRREKTYRRGGS